VNSLQQKIIELEQEVIASSERSEQNQTLNLKSALSELLKRSQTSKIDQQADYTLKPNIGSYLQENDTQINSNLQQGEEPRNEISESVSEASKMTSDESFQSQQYNISSNQEKGQNQPNFITLGKISEEDKIEIIKLGFQRQAEGKISLKKYYESTDPYSLFQYKRYSIKYEAIRKNKLYKQFKP
jgi:hypothetical protein